MKSLILKGAERKELGSKNAKALRNDNQVPCVVYGGDSQIHFSADEREFTKFVYTPNVYIAVLNIDGKEYKTIIKDIQFHPVTDKIIHVDFLQITAEKPVTIKIPVILQGNSIGVRNGGALKHSLKRISVTALEASLPDVIEINIAELKIGQFVRVDQLNIEGVTFNESPASVVVGVKTSRAVVSDEEEGTEAVAEGAEATPAGA